MYKILTIVLLWGSIAAAPYKTSLLIKIPTRSRPHKIFETLDHFYAHLSHEVSVLFHISCDNDDETMNNPEVIARLSSYPNLIYGFHDNRSKIEAFNRDLNLCDFEMVIGAQDDSIPAVTGFDKIIVETMHTHFPDLDGVLNLHDGHIGAECNTLPVIGKKFFDRLGYYYHPDYKALVCDVEITNVSKMLQKEHIVDETIILHNHPAWGGCEQDALYIKNEQYHSADLNTFFRRRACLYDLSIEELDATSTKMWSILIPINDENRSFATQLIAKLQDQIAACGLQEDIEILTAEHSRQQAHCSTIKNRLMFESVGKYIQFLDPGDDIHESFISILFKAMQANTDCISLNGTITFSGNNPKSVIHSLQFDSYFEKNDVYYRPPNPLNPIKRWIAVQFPFYDKVEFMDLDWAKRIMHSQIMRTETLINTPYYFFKH